jgi:hypothetical protein
MNPKVQLTHFNYLRQILLSSRPLLSFLTLFMACSVQAQAPVNTCNDNGIGSVELQGAGSMVTILEVSTGMAEDVPYCLVKVLVPEAINIWVGLPMDDAWNGRWQSVGGGGYAGRASVPNNALAAGFAAATTDTGHTTQVGGSFGMLEPGKPNTQLQIDFAYRSEHLMAEIGKQLVEAFYGEAPAFSYWNGCSTGGRQGLRMAQDYPDDYDGILAGAPAIHWDRFQAGQIWYQVVQLRENGGYIGNGDREVLAAKQQLATARAIAVCDALDGVTDGVLGDPRQCAYSAVEDNTITSAQCTAVDSSCLTRTEASAIDKMWVGPVACANGSIDCSVPDVATRDLDNGSNQRLWYASTRGTNLTPLGGATPFRIALQQPRFWVYYNSDWDWQVLDYDNYREFFMESVSKVGPVMGSDNPDLSAFRDRGSKLVIYHGWSDPLIVPEGSIDYYDRVTETLGGGYAQTQEFARLFMAPGVAHCAGGDGPQPQGLFESVVNWVENDSAPETILATKQIEGDTQSRPLCPYPAKAQWTGEGSSNNASNYTCAVND